MSPVRALVGGALLCVCGAAASADTAAKLAVTPQPGAWEQQSRLYANGLDVTDAVAAVYVQYLNSLTPEQRAQVLEQLKAAGVSPNNPGHARYCLTAEQAAQANDPAKILAEVNRTARQCRFEASETTATQFRFRGRCDDPRSFRGTAEGRVTLANAKNWSAQFTGNGSIAGMALGNALLIEGRTTARWVADRCDAAPAK
jgi:hypothetical protein